ncbi:hypothetical protein JFT91_23835 [Pseudomonas sp. TH08]|uniref:hypothetical protein n=1 Tax=Pseudomonas sp. TH08 TaxID=2796374 RepID=UPI001913EB6D|nr:hypothetical protein [Pseudomonas sp. TH08]MBK5535567.1 hypothetical protein [Pseudomonas sp. TH08]
MKRSVLLGLFVTASMMASTSFAAGEPATQCDLNLQTINNMKGQLASKPELSQMAEASVSKAQELKDQGKTEDCVAETQRTILDLRKSTGTNN